MENPNLTSSVISIFDTSIAAYNTGNQIIMDAVNLEIRDIFKEHFLVQLPVEDIKTNVRRYNSLSYISFLGGTNILNSDIRNYRQWDLSFHNILVLKNIVLMGCGWFQYENIKITCYTKWAFNRVLSHQYVHSVRDTYTKEKLSSIDISSINTGCPTLWRLTNQITEKIPQKKAKRVIITLTDYNCDQERDRYLLDTCCKEYEQDYYFAQGTGDIQYLKDLGYAHKVTLLSPQLPCYNEILSQGNIDYIGTRLHAGIRALQNSVRSFIIGIDNRAIEMANDFCLPVLNQHNLSELTTLINKDYSLDLTIPFENINQWRAQFTSK